MDAEVKDKLNDLKIEPLNLGCGLAGLFVGGCAGYATERILDALIPETGNVPLDILLAIGKWGIAGYVGDKVGEDFARMAHTTISESQRIMEEMFKEMEAEEEAEEVFVEAEVA